MTFIYQSIKRVTAVLLLSTVTASAMAKNDAVEPESGSKSVLMVVSSYGSDGGKTTPGFEFDEFAKAYLVFKNNGIHVDVASPSGGKVEADEYNPEKPFNVEALADQRIMAKLNNTLVTESIDAVHYDGVFVVGGKGAMFDLPKDTALQQTIAKVYENTGVVAAVCHGPAALVDVKLSSGEYLVADKAVNGFTNAEERLFGKKWVKEFDFMLEDKLKQRGGEFESTHVMLSHVVVDERLITGQNPSSTVAVATEMVKALGQDPVATEAYRDDKTLALVARVLANDTSAIEVLSNLDDEYHVELIGMYGFYYLNTAETEQAQQHALQFMQSAQSAINNPQLDIVIAQTQHKLGDLNGATSTLEQILQQHPDFEPALAMQKSLSL